MKQIHLMQASMQFSDTNKQTSVDFDRILSRRADAVGFTEMTKQIALATEACKKAGYFLSTVPGQDIAIALRKDHKMQGSGFELVTPANSTPGNPFANRGIYWIRFNFEGESVFFSEGHWLTGRLDDPERYSEYMEMTQTMIDTVNKQATGRAIAFFGGDVNSDAAFPNRHPFREFKDAGLRTIWDELGLTLNTLNGRTIDVLGSVDKDKRVSADHVRVWPKLNTDHSQISAYYNVK